MAESAGLGWYNTGTIKVTQGSSAVTGTNTTWSSSGIKSGDILTLDDTKMYEILSVNSNTSLTLKKVYGEASGSNVNYSIIRNFAATVTSELAAKVSLLVNKYESYIDADLEKITGPAADFSSQYKGIWASGKSYKAVDIVIHNDKVYISKAAHTSNATNAPNGTGSQWLGLYEQVPVDTIGTLSSLTTDAKATLTAAINEVDAHADTIGTLSELDTPDKSSVVNAIKSAYIIPKLLNDKGIHHNFIYRGKNLGTGFTDEQYAGIAKGTFDDLFLGDYITIPWGDTVSSIFSVKGETAWYIVGFNYFKNLIVDNYPMASGFITEATNPANHVLLMNTCAFKGINGGQSNYRKYLCDGGYAGCEARKSIVEEIKPHLDEVFGEHLYGHYEPLSNAVDANYNITGYGKYLCYVELPSLSMMTEHMTKPLYAPYLYPGREPLPVTHFELLNHYWWGYGMLMRDFDSNTDAIVWNNSRWHRSRVREVPANDANPWPAIPLYCCIKG